MIVHIVRVDGFVAAMGHRVALHLGGEPELKRRVLGTLAQLDDPPEEIRFDRLEPTDVDTDPDPAEQPREPPAAPDAPAELEPKGDAPEPQRGAAKGKAPPRRRR
jgi:hypothetical protein